MVDCRFGTEPTVCVKCLAEDYHFRILLRNERGILTLKAVQALDMNNTA